MSGIQYIVDTQGKETAVVIDLKEHANLWEDFYDNLLANERKNEPRESITSVRKHLEARGKLNG